MSSGATDGGPVALSDCGHSGPQRFDVFAHRFGHIQCPQMYAGNSCQPHVLRLDPDEVNSNRFIRPATPKLPSGLQQVALVLVCWPAVVRSTNADWVSLRPSYFL